MATYSITLSDQQETLIALYDIHPLQVIKAALRDAVQRAAAEQLAEEAGRQRRIELNQIEDTFRAGV